jgi:hypothetical protein
MISVPTDVNLASKAAATPPPVEFVEIEKRPAPIETSNEAGTMNLNHMEKSPVPSTRPDVKLLVIRAAGALSNHTPPMAMFFPE